MQIYESQELTTVEEPSFSTESLNCVSANSWLSSIWASGFSLDAIIYDIIIEYFLEHKLLEIYTY